MTNEEIEAEVNAQAGVISTAHEGAEIAHYIMACRICCLQHFMGLERERCAKVAEKMGPTFSSKPMHEAADAIAKEIRGT
jgi:hypothetical protein